MTLTPLARQHALPAPAGSTPPRITPYGTTGMLWQCANTGCNWAGVGTDPVHAWNGWVQIWRPEQ